MRTVTNRAKNLGILRHSAAGPYNCMLNGGIVADNAVVTDDGLGLNDGGFADGTIFADEYAAV